MWWLMDIEISGKYKLKRGIIMNINLLNSMILSENYEELIEWYIKTFDLTIKAKVEEGV